MIRDNDDQSDRLEGTNPGIAGELLHYDRRGWAWEFLRRNPKFRALFKKQRCRPKQITSNIAVIEVSDCAPEVRNFGICFRR